MIRLSPLLLFAATVAAQCQRGQHPPGVSSIPGTTAGCNEVDGTGRLTWFSLFVVPSERGGPMTLSFLDPPSVGPRPAFAVGYAVVSAAIAVPGIRVPGTSDPGCTWHVPLDLLFPVLVPLQPGCQAVQLLTLPPLPGLAGAQFNLQVWAHDLTVGRSFTTNPIRVTVQP